MGDDEWFEEAYPGSNYVKLVLEWDGASFTLKVKTKEVPGTGQSGQIFAKREENGKIVFDFGLGDEEMDEKEVPNPIKKLIDSKGGGPEGNYVRFPPRNEIIKDDYTVRPYPEYASRWKQRWLAGKDKMERPLPKPMYMSIAKFYLDLLGVPLYL